MTRGTRCQLVRSWIDYTTQPTRVTGRCVESHRPGSPNPAPPLSPPKLAVHLKNISIHSSKRKFSQSPPISPILWSDIFCTQFNSRVIVICPHEARVLPSQGAWSRSQPIAALIPTQKGRGGSSANTFKEGRSRQDSTLGSGKRTRCSPQGADDPGDLAKQTRPFASPRPRPPPTGSRDRKLDRHVSATLSRMSPIVSHFVEHRAERGRASAHRAGDLRVGTLGTSRPAHGDLVSCRDHSRRTHLQDLAFTKEGGLRLRAASDDRTTCTVLTHAMVAEVEGHHHLAQRFHRQAPSGYSPLALTGAGMFQ